MSGAGRNEAPWIGVLGGSFDPVHVGHVKIAEAVRASFSLSRVLLAPAATPPHKPEVRLASEEHRLEMLELALAGHDGLEVSTIELDRGGVSYTIDTLRALRDDRVRPVRPLFILGMDSLIDIPTWKEHRRLLDEFAFVVVDRPHRPGAAESERLAAEIAGRLIPVGCEPGAGAAALERQGRPRSVFKLTIAPIDVSSSRIRRLAAEGADLGGLVPPAVARYIQREQLYRQEAAR